MEQRRRSHSFLRGMRKGTLIFLGIVASVLIVIGICLALTR